ATHIFYKKYFEEYRIKLELIAKDNINEVFTSLEEEHYIIVPFLIIDSKGERIATPAKDNLNKVFSLETLIINWITLKVNHYLLSKCKDLNKIKKIYSHFEAFEECKDKLRNIFGERLKNDMKNNLHPVSRNKLSTSEAAQLVANEPYLENSASISNKLYAKLYGLNFLLNNSIQDDK
ncbi:2421_t:CDS:2, partial [Racocetra persica]